MKNSADLGGCYPPRPSASVDNALLDLQNSSYPTRPHSIIANYLMTDFPKQTLNLNDLLLTLNVTEQFLKNPKQERPFFF